MTRFPYIPMWSIVKKKKKEEKSEFRFPFELTKRRESAAVQEC